MICYSLKRPRTAHAKALPKALALVAVAMSSVLVTAGTHAKTVNPDWDTPKQFDTMSPHPRLYVSKAQLQRAVGGRGDEYAEAYDRIEKAAKTGLEEADNPMADISTHRRQFMIVGRLSAMALQYHRTGDKRYIEASVTTIENMKDWYAPRTLWQLWHGGFSTAIAINYDLLYNDMTPQQRKRVVNFAREHVIRPFLRNTGRGKNLRQHGERGSWWQGIISNWNPVCSAGAGMLALAMYEDLDEAQTVIDRVNASLDNIIKELQVTNGGWVEGLGYWNWTMHYMSLFYISYERATGTQHEGFRSPGFRGTLTFVDYFVPYGSEAAGFGDNQHGSISNSLLAAAEQMGDTKILVQLLAYKDRQQQAREDKQRREQQSKKQDDTKSTDEAEDGKDETEPVNISYGEINRVLILPDPVAGDGAAEVEKNVTHFYPKPGWGMLADRWPEPTVYVAFRAGQLGGAHTQDDLLSWHGLVGKEFMIKNIYGGHVSQNSFGSRRNDLFEVSSQSKNSLLVGGLGPKGRRGERAKANTTLFDLPTGPMARLEATRAMDTTRNRPRFAARAFVIIGDHGLLVLDRVIAPSGKGQPVEARMYTTKKATFSESDVLLEGDIETARITVASNVEATLSRAIALMSFPRPNTPTMIRFQTNRSEHSTVMASLLSRGSDPVDLSVDMQQVKAEDGKNTDGPITVTIKGKGWSDQIKLTTKLEPIE